MTAASVGASAPKDRRGRVLALLVANFSNQGVTALLQFATLPALLTQWSLEVAGTWLILNAYASIFSLADWGLAAVAMNRIATVYANGEHERARRLYGSAFIVVALLLAMALLLGNLAVTGLVHAGWVPAGYRLPFALLSIHFGLQSFGSLFDAAFRALDRSPEGTYLGSASRIVEWGCGIAALFIEPTLAFVAAGFAAGKVVTFVASILYVRYRLGHFRLTSRISERAEIRALLLPAFAYLHFPIGNMLSLQMTSVVVGHLFGPAFLTVFSAYRTLSRIIVQLFTSASYSVWPEFNRLQGQRRYADLARLFRASSLWVGGASTAIALTMPVFAAWFVPIWSRGAFGVDHLLFGMMMLAAWLSSLAQVPNVLVVSFSRHVVLARWFMAAAVVNVVLCYGFGLAFGHVGVMLAAIASEGVILYKSTREARSCFADLPAAA